MKYKFVERGNPQDKAAPKKLYASPINDGTMSNSELSKEIVNISSLARGDVSNTLETLLDVIPKYLTMGKSVKLGNFGTFRVSFSSAGVETEDEFHVGMISGRKVIFTPGNELKEALRNMKFERVK